MISSETPYKLAEIIRDTWPNLFHNLKNSNDTSGINNNLKSKHKSCHKVN